MYASGQISTREEEQRERALQGLQQISRKLAVRYRLLLGMILIKHAELSIKLLGSRKYIKLFLIKLNQRTLCSIVQLCIVLYSNSFKASLLWQVVPYVQSFEWNTPSFDNGPLSRPICAFSTKFSFPWHTISSDSFLYCVMLGIGLTIGSKRMMPIYPPEVIFCKQKIRSMLI